MDIKDIKTCEELERAALAAAHEEAAKQERERIESQKASYEEAFAQLKEELPLLERSGDGETFVMCGRKWSYCYHGREVDKAGRYKTVYALVNEYPYEKVYDLVSLGDWLKNHREAKKRSWWKKLFP